MTVQTMDEKLSQLKPEQKGVIWDYYRLITKDDQLLKEEIEIISKIWEIAEGDEQLLKWLEFVDYLYTNVDENDLPSDEKRAYLSEYLAAKAGMNGGAKSSLIVRILKCPNGKGEVLVLWDERKQGPINSSAFKEYICHNCQQKYSEHIQVEGGVTLPRL